MIPDVDVIVVGGGIVGLATAHQLLDRFPDRSVLVLEKEASVGFHQTGHNSGVLHSGIYYKPDSLRATNCRAGKLAMEAFCRQHNIPHDICGKVIVAVDEREETRLQAIFERGQQNGVRCELINATRLRELEPHAAGVRAIHVPEAGIVNYRRVTEKLAELVASGSSRVLTGTRVESITTHEGHVEVKTSAGVYTAAQLVTCAGLHSDRVARRAGQQLDSRIVPFRGEYYDIRPDAHDLCRNLIYPVPDPAFPFLGVHFTRMIDGGVECGPNAVLAFAREGYRKTDVNLKDLFESLSYPGFLRLAARCWREGMGEMWRSWSKAAFVRALQRLVPDVKSEDLIPARAGVRAQALAPTGQLVDDFLILEQPRAVHVCNAPSPAATSSLNIGRLIVDKLAPRFQ